MTQIFKNLSIKTKLTLVIMLVSTVLLFLIGSIVLVVEVYSARGTVLQELRILANTLSANSRHPLILEQYTGIEAILKSVTQQKNIHAAYVFDRNGAPVAEYLSQQNSHFLFKSLKADFKPENSTLWSAPVAEKPLFDVYHLSLFTPIVYDGKTVGTLYLLGDLTRLYSHLAGVGFGIILSLLLMILFSWFLADRLQRPVSTPILQLVQLMGNISAVKDYSLRAKKVSDDEIGALVDGFNQMLDQIELHQARLAEHQLYLEQTVLDRTSELRSAVVALEQARKQADAANEAKSHFLSRMTHDLRTPLIGVLGMNELLLRTPLTSQQQELAGTVQKSAQQLLQLVNEVLDFSRIEAGKLTLNLTTFPLHQVVEDVAALLWPQAEEKGLSLQTDISLDACQTVKADEVRIRQILTNLVGNAIKFTQSGTITVRLQCPECLHQKGSFFLEVVDSGVGMTAEVKQQVYDAFYQVNGTGSGAMIGTGLGLAIVKQLVDLMNGQLNLISSPGQGSRFQVRVELPIVDKNTVVEGEG
ncbi:Signal transduction histidine kinase [Desulfuromusa kysingii]|uniref:histidine kinase n=1 Tax=Desulfuromusa kysingii TaxID=37625 RepID=A0A1H3YM51_9BACT|nr:ATP-binding protein [Desulfuromusa kysingii]SEA12613.1 Signal transduction histidine kinase [Desulfuromusa kysingii]